MTTASHKNQLFVKLQELDTAHQEKMSAQQKADKARSDLHCIIATLPGDGELPREAKTEETRTPLASSVSRPIITRPVIQQQHGDEEQTSSLLLDNLVKRNRLHNPKDRPVVIKTPQQEAAEKEPPPTPPAGTKPKKTRKRTKEADIRKAVKLFFDSANTDSPLTQEQAEKAVKIPQGVLSKGKGKDILEEYIKEISRLSRRIDAPNGVRRKAVEDANRYENR